MILYVVILQDGTSLTWFPGTYLVIDALAKFLVAKCRECDRVSWVEYCIKSSVNVGIALLHEVYRIKLLNEDC